ncbi:hypothetical protein DENSPDRAFT_846301 [Dentipellis sp. KUC8613]|nr:hypothetical protein DENSPDRAFT_846301 [Dentipellis sp. KUC8613]
MSLLASQRRQRSRETSRRDALDTFQYAFVLLIGLVYYTRVSLTLRFSLFPPRSIPNDVARHSFSFLSTPSHCLGVVYLVL